jgi:hypothetical protein
VRRPERSLHLLGAWIVIDAAFAAFLLARQEWLFASVMLASAIQSALQMWISQTFYGHGWRVGRAALFASMSEGHRVRIDQETWIKTEMERPPTWPKPGED